MRRATLAGLAVVITAGTLIPAVADAAPRRAKATIGETEITLGNGLVERRWARDGFRTLALTDRRGRDRTWSAGSRDFTLEIGDAVIGSERFDVTATRVERLPGNGTRLEMTLTGVPGLTVTRVAEVRPGIAAMRFQTILETVAAVPVSATVLDEAIAPGAKPTAHAFRAGADWRDGPDYAGPPSIGDNHGGTWRATREGEPGEPFAAPAQWLTLSDGGRDVALVAQGTDFPSNRAAYDGKAGRLRSDFGRDVIILGPFEESGHIENPTDSDGRFRTAAAGRPVAFDPVIVAFGTHDGDLEWQFNKLLRRLRAGSVQQVVFNSNNIDNNAISTGAKDDMDIAMVRRLAPVARQMGIETFVLDDGWQARSGDWCPDSPECPEPRHGTSPKFAPRFPDSDFTAVREAIAPMKLGLWMSPLHFHPSSQTWKDHPEWQCQPLATGLGAYNTIDPASSSNEAGLVTWGPDVLPYIKGRIEKAIVEWEVEYFKFDFIAWLDCAGQDDLYGFRDRFVTMLDELRAEHPHVLFTIDETNDYRMFPYGSTTRGATWFQNGSPSVDHLLHNLWNLSPYVPAEALGQNVLGKDRASQPVSTMIAAALASHVSYFGDIREYDLAAHPAKADMVAEIAEWNAFYRANKRYFSGVTYPLLSDPFGGRAWTALQTWDPDKGRGALLAFRQDSADATEKIALRNVPPGETFTLRRAPSGEDLGTVTAAELAEGIEITIGSRRGAEVILLDRVV